MNTQILPEERRSQILSILLEERKLAVPDLSNRLHVSIDTIRRDLIELEQAGHLSRVHGGALPKSPANKPYYTRKNEHSQNTITIAKTLASLIKGKKVIFLDSGTTAVEIARALPTTLEGTIVTTSPLVAVALVDHSNIDIIMLPGILSRETMSVTGAATLCAIKTIHADICIVGVCGIHPEIGLTTSNYEESIIKQQMITNSSETLVAISEGKLGTAVAFKVAPINCINRLVTTSSVAEEKLIPYKNSNIEIILAS